MKRLPLPSLIAFGLLFAGLCLITFPHLFSSGDIDLKIEPNSVIMPAAYKVYGNPDVLGGRYNLFKAVIRNNGNSELKNLKVEYRIPKYVDEWTEVPSTKNLLPGQTAVVTCFPVFPQSITDKNTSSKEKTEIRITYGGKANLTERDESFTFDMLSVNDMVFSNMADKDAAYYRDKAGNMPLYACFVTAEDPIIKYYAQQVQQKVLGGETGAGVGTSGDAGEKEVREALRVMEGVYNATLRTKMVYSETSSSVTQFGDNTSSTEHIRLPREVVTGNTGLCIELALLHASVLKAAGMSPMIFLIPGHAFPGIKFGNAYYAIESTMIGGDGIGGSGNADQALAYGMKELQNFFDMVRKGDPRYMMLDINALYAQGFTDMELKDDPYLRQKVDQLSQSFASGPDAPQQQTQNNEETASNTNTRSSHPTRTTSSREDNSHTETVKPRLVSSAPTMLQYSGNISFVYPKNWIVKDHPIPQMPFVTAGIFSPDQTSGIEIFQLEGAPNPRQAMAYIQQSIMRMGGQVRYTQTGAQYGLDRYSGSTLINGVTTNWIASLRRSGMGVDAVVVGTRTGATPILDQVLMSIR